MQPRHADVARRFPYDRAVVARQIIFSAQAFSAGALLRTRLIEFCHEQAPGQPRLVRRLLAGAQRRKIFQKQFLR